ncbi:MAG: molybdopterin-binding protein, partial [Candidatus Limnocylindrales bacterium]
QAPSPIGRLEGTPDDPSGGPSGPRQGRLTSSRVRIEQLVPGERPDPNLVGAVLTGDLQVGREHWSKGRRLSASDLASLAGLEPTEVIGQRERARAGLTVLVPDPGEIHEDEAAGRLATAIAGGGLVRRGPAESRVDLLAAAPGVVHVRVGLLERLNRIDTIEVFSVFDGQIVSAGELVASAKVAPHLVPAATLDRAVGVAGQRGIVGVAPFVPRRVSVVVKESLHPLARERFEASVRAKVESLGSRIVGFEYAEDRLDSVARALAAGGAASDVILTAGSASTDPSDPFFVAIDRLGGRIVRRGVPAHPGSMLWLARLGRVDILGLPTCGAYSRATAADLILPRLLTGERVSRGLVAGLGHGGVLGRSMRFRFPAYARDLEAPDG